VEDLYQDCYMVFVRDEAGRTQRPEDVEDVVMACATYQDAARVKQELRGAGKHCIIRSVGQVGGGD
jgi:hypothetical protein